MEIVVTARHTEVTERFRRHLEDKLTKVEQLAPRAQRLEVAVSHEANPRQSGSCERVEITVRDKGPVIRAEACADDVYAALDLAQQKLVERLRRARDRQKVHHGRHAPRGLRDEQPVAAVQALADLDRADAPEEPHDESPVLIRQKTHLARPMTLDDALYEMELVGHDFFLFVDAESDTASVVYRRKGWSYGVIRLGDSESESEVRLPSESAPVVSATG